jgi:hypothetical protein
LQGGVQGHKREQGELSLGGQQAIKGVAVSHGVATGMEALLQRDWQQIKALGPQVLGQGLNEIAHARQLAQAHFGSDLPAGGGAPMHRIGRFADGGKCRRREAIWFSLSSPTQPHLQHLVVLGPRCVESVKLFFYLFQSNPELILQ